MIVAVIAAAALATPETIERGHALAAQLCANCHAIEWSDTRLRQHAPPFRDLGGGHPPFHLVEGLAEGVIPPHAGMRPFALTAADAQALAAYVTSVQKR